MDGLFGFGGLGGEGGFDMDALMKMINPIGSAEAATPFKPNSFDDRFSASFPNRAEGGPLQLGPGVAPEPTPQDLPGTPPAPPQLTPPPPAPPMLPRALSANPVTPVLGKPSIDDVTTGAAVNSAAQPTVGAALTGQAGGNTDMSARAKDTEKRPNLAQALRGAVMPKGPELQKISTPAAPRPLSTIKSGDLQALLLALNAGAPNLQRQLPTTLGRG